MVVRIVEMVLFTSPHVGQLFGEVMRRALLLSPPGFLIRCGDVSSPASGLVGEPPSVGSA
jgi:hypothetical protein